MKKLFNYPLFLVVISFLTTSCTVYKHEVSFQNGPTKGQTTDLIKTLEVDDKVVVKSENGSKSRGKVVEVNKTRFSLQQSSHKANPQTIIYQEVVEIKYKVNKQKTILGYGGLGLGLVGATILIYQAVMDSISSSLSF